MSRTTIDLNDDLVAEALAITEAPTKKAVIEQALQELVNSRKRQALIDMVGKGTIGMTLEDLLNMRRASRRFD